MGAGMFALMFAMGLTLGMDDFRRIVRSPRATAVGTSLQLIVMPIVGITLSNILGLSPLLSTGLGMIEHVKAAPSRAP